MLFFQQKKCLLCFFSRSRSLSPFFSLSFAGLPPAFSFSLSFSWYIYSKFVDMTINLNLILYSLVVSVYKTLVAMWLPFKITSSCIWITIPVDWVILHWYACGADGRSGGRSSYGHVITTFSQMGSLPPFLTHGALHARASRKRAPLIYRFSQG